MTASGRYTATATNQVITASFCRVEVFNESGAELVLSFNESSTAGSSNKIYVASGQSWDGPVQGSTIQYSGSGSFKLTAYNT